MKVRDVEDGRPEFTLGSDSAGCCRLLLLGLLRDDLRMKKERDEERCSCLYISVSVL